MIEVVFYTHLVVYKRQEYVFYFTDVSEMKRAQLAYIKNRPIIMLLQTDDIADIKADYRDSERATIRGGVEEVIENWLSLIHI